MRLYYTLLISLFLIVTAPLGYAQINDVYDPFESNKEIVFQPKLIIPDDGTGRNFGNIEETSDKETTVLKNLLSPLEHYYSDRVEEELLQFGYDVFSEENNPDFDFLPSGAVQDDFILGFGDTLSVTLRGQVNSQKNYRIDRDGLLTLDDLAPVPAAGRTMAQVESALKSQLASLPNIDLYLSLDKVRQINVLIIGHVKKPGRHTLNVFHTALDALSAAGGIERTGTLRHIKLIRDGRTKIIDLYNLFLQGGGISDERLQDGDRLIVPPIGPTIAIAGAVKQPGIYEILKDHSTTTDHEGVNSERLSMKSALSLCGGVLAAGQNRFMHLSLSLNGSEDVQTIVDPLAPLLRDGSVLLVSSTEETRQGMVELTGHTRKNGIHPLSKNPALSALLSPEALGEKVYPLLGVIERFDPVTLKRSFISFPLHLVLRGTHDQKLADRDTVHLFSLPQIYNLMQDTAPSLIQPALSGTKDTQTTQSYQEAMIPDPLLRSILREQSVFVKGAVRLAGAYPVTHETSLDDILNVTGGLTLEANPERIEVTTLQASGENERHLVNLQQSNPASIILKSGSTIRVNETNRKMKNDTIYISGQVVQPGDYNLVPGDRLSTLLARAGGLTPEAYPEGAIFSRMSERKAEEARFRAAAQELEQSLAAAIENNKNNKPDYNQIAMTKSLAGELRSVKAVGRITVEADPYELQLHPELDIVLQPGDKIHIPVRPYIVRVRGEVLSPANLQFREDKSPRDYVREAGGFTHYADKERSFVVHPDGSAQPLASAYWRHKPDIIPPGSTIIVPRDPKPFDFMETAKDISQILGNLAVSAVVIDDLQNDE